MRSTAPASAGSRGRKGRSRFGSEKTHCRTGSGGKTSSLRRVATSTMRRVLQSRPGLDPGRADAAALAGEGDQTLGAAVCAAGAGEAVGQDTAAKIGAEVVLGPAGDRVALGIGADGQGEEALEMRP
jgi:hypothetical protein